MDADFVDGMRTRREVAEIYADIISYSPSTDVVEINERIQKRWSRSALDYIKRLAWKIHDARRPKPKEK